MRIKTLALLYFGVRKCCSPNIITNILHFVPFVEFHSCFFLDEERNIKVSYLLTKTPVKDWGIKQAKQIEVDLDYIRLLMCFRVKNI